MVVPYGSFVIDSRYGNLIGCFAENIKFVCLRSLSLRCTPNIVECASGHRMMILRSGTTYPQAYGAASGAWCTRGRQLPTRTPGKRGRIGGPAWKLMAS